jgi:flagellar hook-associated protein FlgK
MSLTSDKRACEEQLRQLEKCDNDAADFNKKIERLIDALYDDISSSNMNTVVEAIEELSDKPVQHNADSSVNSAKSALQAEIRVIEAAIEAQRRAAAALAGAGGGGGGGGSF